MVREAPNRIDALSADDVNKLPDTNIAEALRRLPSVYLIRDQGEGRYVSIRGADPVLNNVTMNGQTIAVSDTDGESGRAAPLDVLSSRALSRVEIRKVTLPNMDGQSIGGTINIVTPSGFDYPDSRLSLNAEVGYNDLGKDSDIYAGNVAYAARFGANEEFAVFASGEYWFKQYTSLQYTTRPAGGDGPTTAFRPTTTFRERWSTPSPPARRSATAVRPTSNSARTTAPKRWVRGYFYAKYNDYRERPQISICHGDSNRAARRRHGHRRSARHPGPNEFYAGRVTRSRWKPALSCRSVP